MIQTDDIFLLIIGATDDELFSVPTRQFPFSHAVAHGTPPWLLESRMHLGTVR